MKALLSGSPSGSRILNILSLRLAISRKPEETPQSATL